MNDHERQHCFKVSRRQMLAAGTSAALAGGLLARQTVAAAPTSSPAVRYCLNMSTVRGQKLSVPEQVDLAAKAGYDAIEPWMGDVHGYVQGAAA
jgi:hypothetical protein